MKNNKGIIKKKKKSPKYSLQLELTKVKWEKAEKIFDRDKDLLLHDLSKKKLIHPQTKEILKVLAGGAVIALSLLMPALPMAIAPLVIKRNQYHNQYFDQTMDRLKRQKLVEVIETKDGSSIVRITDKGKVRALRYKLGEVKVKKPRVWDRKWRVVIFDIPEKFKRMREIFRRHLQIMGFYMLQKSVWVHPYPCFDEIEFLRQIYDVGVDVTYLVAEKLEGAEDIKSFFQLS